MKLLFARYVLLFGSLASGCSKIPPPGDDFVSCIIKNRIDSQVGWRQNCSKNEEIQNYISYAISRELSADTAIQIALLNNPKIQAIFENLRIARANLVEAGLLSNPDFALEVRYPHISRLKTNIEYLLITSILDMFLIPLRTKLANTEFEQTKLNVANEILNLAFEVRAVYYELITEKTKIDCIHSSVEISKIMSDLSSRQLSIGNVYAHEFQKTQSRFLEAELALSQPLAETIRLKEKFNRLLGFSEDVCLILPDNLPSINFSELDLNALESLALEQRLDLKVARFEIARLCQMLGLKEGWTYTNLKAGLAGEREPEGANLTGPGFSGEIPIFNYGRADRMRLHALLRQAQDRLCELEIKTLSEVREAHKLLMSYLKIIKDYRDHLIPLQEKISVSSVELYNVMGLGIDKLLDSKRQEIAITQNYTEILKKYLIAQVELDRAVGGTLFKLLSQVECEEKTCQ